MAELDVNSIRYMDDILIFAPTRWKLRHAIRVLNQTFAELGLEQHPGKTFIGRTVRGFDFLGYHVAPERVTLAAHTIRRMNQKALRLYEQEPQDAQARVQRLGVYLMRWRRWTRAGLCRRGETFESLTPPDVCRRAAGQPPPSGSVRVGRTRSTLTGPLPLPTTATLLTPVSYSLYKSWLIRIA